MIWKIAALELSARGGELDVEDASLNQTYVGFGLEQYRYAPTNIVDTMTQYHYYPYSYY